MFNLVDAGLTGALVGIFIALLVAENIHKRRFEIQCHYTVLEKNRAIEADQRATLEMLRAEEAERLVYSISVESEQDAVIAEEARKLYMTWWGSKRSIDRPNIVEKIVIQSIEDLGALIVSSKGIKIISEELVAAQIENLPDYKRKLQRVYENKKYYMKTFVEMTEEDL